MRPWPLLCLTIFLVSFLSFVDLNDANPDPGRRSGGGGRKSSGGFGSWFGGSKKNNNNYGNNYGNNNNYGGYGNNYKKKSSGMKTLKKAAVIGAVAYGGYQLGKLSAGYNHWGWGQSHGYGFNDWNRWREIDGFLCRTNDDCNWIDRQLYCQDYELKFQPSALWFGGDVASIVGECACPYGKYFDNNEMMCRYNFMGGTFGIIALVVGFLIITCCCCGIVLVARKVMG